MKFEKSGFQKPYPKRLALLVMGIWFAGSLFGDLSIERLIEDRAVRLLIEGDKGDTWTVEFSNDLKSWQGLGEVGQVILDDTGKGELVITPTTEAEFYRTSLSKKANGLPAP